MCLLQWEWKLDNGFIGPKSEAADRQGPSYRPDLSSNPPECHLHQPAPFVGGIVLHCLSRESSVFELNIRQLCGGRRI
uniref:Uncharacterized protein n=1 Tax=Cyprinodon variegatus TaxID=28743 RepID=A0A3Q2CHC7_CYPVA